MITETKELLENIIKPYSAILFLNNKVAGILIILITFMNYRIAVSGMIAIASILLFAKLIEFKSEYFSEGFYIYNSLLVGMGIGFIFPLSYISISLIIIASIFTFLLSFMLNRLFSVYSLPILSLPFSIITILIYLASYKYIGHTAVTFESGTSFYNLALPSFLSSFFRSVGTIFFLPNALSGFLLSLIVLYFSRILFIIMVTGFYFGVAVHAVFLGSYESALLNPYNFNYIIVATALCGIFLLPTIRNFFIAMMGVLISVVISDALHTIFYYYGIPVFTLPFNMTVTAFIFVLSMLYYKEFNYNIKSTPEESLSYYLSNIFRFGSNQIKISLPFSGEWSVYQDFNGEWTHKGKYKYAYDFVKTKYNKTYKAEGLFLTDYYAFGESILSPISGYVIDAREDLSDNIIGEVDRVNNWGNYIIIKSDLGFYIEISHLMQYSLHVKIGDYIKLNQIIAKCGNSGYSPEPHIHIQVQEIGVINAFTKKFTFSEYYVEKQLLFNHLPKKGELIRNVIVNKNVHSRLIFILDDVLHYDIYEDGEKRGTTSFTVCMNSGGEFYFEDEKNNKLFFYADHLMFYFYHYSGENSALQQLFILAPRIPYIHKDGIYFTDYLPINLLYSKLKTMKIELLSTVNKNFYKIEKRYTYNAYSLSSDLGEVTFSPHNKGFQTICYQKTKLIRKEP